MDHNSSKNYADVDHFNNAAFLWTHLYYCQQDMSSKPSFQGMDLLWSKLQAQAEELQV